MSSGHRRKVSQGVVAAAFATGEPVHCEYCNKRVWLNVHRNALNRAIGEHRVPLARGGLDTEANTAIACRNCDRQKGPLTEDEFLRLRSNPAQLAQWRDSVLLCLQRRRERREHVRSSRLAS